MRRYGFALLAAAAAAVGSVGTASAATPYDGRWSVVIQTVRGNCDQAYRYGLNIVNGNVTYDGSGGFDVKLSYTYLNQFDSATFSVSVTDHGASTSQTGTVQRVVFDHMPAVADQPGSAAGHLPRGGAVRGDGQAGQAGQDHGHRQRHHQPPRPDGRAIRVPCTIAHFWRFPAVVRWRSTVRRHGPPRAPGR